MPENIEELVVAAKPEGLDETTDGLEKMEGQFNETAESMGETGEEFEDMQKKWQGALTAIVSGMAVAVGGLATQVPILGELGASVASVLEAIGFQIDQLLRDLGAGGLTGILYDLSAAIYEADGALGDIIGTLGAIGGIIAGAVGGYLSYIAATQGLAAAAGVLKGGLLALGGILKGVLATLGGLVAGSTAAVVAVGSLIGILGVAVLEVTGVLDAFMAFGQWVGEQLPSIVTNAGLAILSGILLPLTLIGSFISGFVSGVLEGGLSEGFETAVSRAQDALDVFLTAWENVIGTLFDKWGEIADIALSWGKDLISDIATGITLKFAALSSSIGGVASEVRETITDLVDSALSWGEDLIDELVSGIENKTEAVGEAMSGVAQEARDRMPGSPAETGPLSDIDESGPGLIEEFASGISANVGQVKTATNQAASAADSDSSGGGFLASRNTRPVIHMDGKKVTESTGRYRADETSRRGRNG